MTSDLPTSTAGQHRVQLFQASRRPDSRVGQEIATTWGTVRVTGRIGQGHADLLEAIMFCAEQCRKMPDGRVKLLVDPARVRRGAAITGGRQLRQLLTELMAVVVEINVVKPEQLRAFGHLVDDVKEAVRPDGELVTRRNPLGGQRVMWRVELGRALVELLEKDIWVGYDPSPIARLAHGISQALARHVLTHRDEPPGGWFLDGLIRAVAGKIGDQAIRDRRRELRGDAEALAVIGIGIVGNRVRRVGQRPDGVGQRPDGVEQRPGAWSKDPV